MDTVDKETRSRIMSSVRSNNTKLEKNLFAILESDGITGFECHVKTLPSKPDIVFTETKIAIFLDSCFWHGCPKHLRKPKSNEEYWQPKIQNNIKRDLRNRSKLRRMGWSVLRIWEHDLKTPDVILKKIRRTLKQRIIPKT
jgi:DNA mismatch endonuclease (patch repair protein)